MKKSLWTLCVCMLVLAMCGGSVAAQQPLNWETTIVDADKGSLYIRGYFSNSPTGKTVDRIEWFQPNITLLCHDGSKVSVHAKDTRAQACYIPPGGTQEMLFIVPAPIKSWKSWTMNAKFSYHSQGDDD
nr:hypothetical protein [uncultured Anaeromusa sp.]